MVISRRLVLFALALGASACAATGTTGATGPPGVAASPPAEKRAPFPLQGPDGAATTLDDLRRGTDATVLVFWSGTCPCVRRYQERVDALLDAHPASRVRVVGISSNAGEPYADVLRVAKERRVRIPILRDEGGRVAGALGVNSTPTVVVLDARGEIRYRGWLDNERLPGEPGREAWLDAALRGVLDGKTAFAARTPTYGCTITRSLFGSQSSPCCTDH